MPRRRLALALLVLAHAPAARADSELLARLARERDQVELARFPAAGSPRVAPIALAARVALAPAALRARLADPATFQRAVPAFVRADVLETKSAPGVPPARLIAWELEVPLWNFSGKLWLRPHAHGVRLDLVEGHLAPAFIELGVSALDAGSALVVSGNPDLRNANWITRRLAARDELAESAMTVTALHVLLRALVLDAAGATAQRQPRGAMGAPPALTLRPDAGPSASATFARVHSRPDGRLHHVEVALPCPVPSERAAVRLLEADRWRTLPGWKEISVQRAPVLTGPRAIFRLWQVDASIPFVDFDATWSLLSERPLRAEARAGDWQGAMLGADVAAAGSGAQLIFSMHPRLDRTGYFPRKLIEAEPLLEHGLALGLAFVDARALVRGLASSPAR